MHCDAYSCGVCVLHWNRCHWPKVGWNRSRYHLHNRTWGFWTSLLECLGATSWFFLVQATLRNTWHSEWANTPVSNRNHCLCANFYCSTSHRQYRFIAYRQLTSWCWGWLGRRVRVVLPSCAVHKIRTKFPSTVYTGFKYPPITSWYMYHYIIALLYNNNYYYAYDQTERWWHCSKIVGVIYRYRCYNGKLKRLLWLAIAVSLSGFSYWLLRGLGMVLLRTAAPPSLQSFLVSCMRVST